MPLSRARLLRLLHLVRDAPLAPVTWPVQSERRWRLFKVRCRRSESRHVVPERLERPVAGPAQKPAHEPGLMIVVDLESHPILWWPTAYGAHPALRRLDQHRLQMRVALFRDRPPLLFVGRRLQRRGQFAVALRIP